MINRALTPEEMNQLAILVLQQGTNNVAARSKAIAEAYVESLQQFVDMNQEYYSQNPPRIRTL